MEPKRNNLKPGTRIKLIHIDEPHTSLKSGSKGTIKLIDESKTIHVNWDNGIKLGLIPEVDQFIIINEQENENRYRPFPKREDRNQKIGERNAKLYRQSEEEIIDGDEISDYDEELEDSNPYEGKERRFRVSFYVDVHVPMTDDIELDRQNAEQEASEILKKLSHKSVSNAYLGGVAHNPFASIPDPKEFERL